MVLPGFGSDISDIAHPDRPVDGQPCAFLSVGVAFEATAVPAVSSASFLMRPDNHHGWVERAQRNPYSGLRVVG